MKFKGLIIGVLFAFILGFTKIALGSPVEQQNTVSNLRVISSNTNLKVGDLGYIVIQGKPGTSYNLRTTYQRGDRNVKVAQMRIADATGRATFNWVVENGTEPGTNQATITGGGETLIVNHIVTE